MEKEQIYGLIRHALTVVGGALVAKGYIDADIVGEAVGCNTDIDWCCLVIPSKEKIR